MVVLIGLKFHPRRTDAPFCDGSFMTLSHVFFDIMILKRHEIIKNDGRNDRLNFPNEIFCPK